ncbi:uncharacterized protein LOC129589856 [Paramacrobiotus metropolitanus]|uniref:uncharacterized protein LOC129589856 n=1 Tax=Paramacrobiotus metropolitanus TaxID=2943436 RepID=UPI0024457DC3|nr:uncharacterized protein LOC129589856 [Paramacrobiotus metropolitanus]
MIKDEMNVILEWIEFHRIQGVEHFVFFDDASTDDIHLLPRLYESLGYPDLVEIIPQNFRKRNKQNDHSYRDHDQGQMQALNHCNSRLTGVTEWLLVTDVDEFTFSSKYHTIADFIRNTTTNDTRHISAKVIRFGSNGVQHENLVRLSLDPYTDQITVTNVLRNGDALLTSRNRRRGPFPGLDADYQKRYNQTCAPTKKPDDCQHAIGKSIWRPTSAGWPGCTGARRSRMECG